jgi:hypothetical protein
MSNLLPFFAFQLAENNLIIQTFNFDENTHISKCANSDERNRNN